MFAVTGKRNVAASSADSMTLTASGMPAARGRRLAPPGTMGILARLLPTNISTDVSANSAVSRQGSGDFAGEAGDPGMSFGELLGRARFDFCVDLT